MQSRLTEAAEQDVADILREMIRGFGPIQRGRYAALIALAVDMVAQQPDRPGSRKRDDLGAGVCSFHIELAAKRRGAAAHVLNCLVGPLGDGSPGVIIARVLHDRMEPLRHITRDRPA